MSVLVDAINVFGFLHSATGDDLWPRSKEGSRNIVSRIISLHNLLESDWSIRIAGINRLNRDKMIYYLFAF